MTAKHEIVIKFTVVQELDDISDIIDPCEMAEQVAQNFADVMADYNAVSSYELISGKVDAK